MIKRFVQTLHYLSLFFIWYKFLTVVDGRIMMLINKITMNGINDFASFDDYEGMMTMAKSRTMTA